MDMVDRQDEHFERLDLEWSGLYGRRLHAIDCQGLFCETDKYARAAFPELKSNRVRIKQEFRPAAAPLPLFYPPKWGINDRLCDPPAGQLTLDEATQAAVDPSSIVDTVGEACSPPTLFDLSTAAV